MFRFEVEFDKNNEFTYNGKTYYWLLRIYVGDTCWYIGRHWNLIDVTIKVEEYRKHFHIE